MATLITVPRLSQPGGVANYYNVLHKYLRGEHTLFEIGARNDQKGPFSSVRRVLRDYWTFHRVLGSRQYSLVHLNPSLLPKSLIRDAIFLIIAKFHSIPILVFFHGWSQRTLKIVNRYFSVLFRQTYGRASEIVVLAHRFQHDLRMSGLTQPITLLTTCVEDSAFLHSIDPPVPAPDRIRILFLSRLDPGKGLLRTLSIFESIKIEFPNAELLVVGDGPVKQAATEYVESRKLSGVEFLGHVEGKEKAEAFLSSQLFVFPSSLDEGMPTTVLEAMAYGLPVVTSAAGGLVDFFENRKMGFMCESSCESEYLAKTRLLIVDGDLRQSISKYNRAFAQERFSASVIASHLENIYSRISG